MRISRRDPDIKVFRHRRGRLPRNKLNQSSTFARKGVQAGVEGSLWGRMTQQGQGYEFGKGEGGWEISESQQDVDQKTRDAGANIDLFRSLLAETGWGTGEQGVHPHWGSLRSDRDLTQQGPKWDSSR